MRHTDKTDWIPMSSLQRHPRFVFSKNMVKGGCALTLAGAMLLPLSPAMAAPTANTPAVAGAVQPG